MLEKPQTPKKKRERIPYLAIDKTGKRTNDHLPHTTTTRDLRNQPPNHLHEARYDQSGARTRKRGSGHSMLANPQDDDDERERERE